MAVLLVVVVVAVVVVVVDAVVVVVTGFVVVVLCTTTGGAGGVGLKSTFFTDILNLPGCSGPASDTFLSFLLGKNSMAGGVVWKGCGVEGLKAVRNEDGVVGEKEGVSLCGTNFPPSLDFLKNKKIVRI